MRSVLGIALFLFSTNAAAIGGFEMPEIDLELTHVKFNCEQPASKAIEDCRENLPVAAAAGVSAAGQQVAAATAGQTANSAGAAANLQSQGSFENLKIGDLCAELAASCRAGCQSSIDHHSRANQRLTQAANLASQRNLSSIADGLRTRATRQIERRDRAEQVSDQYCGFLEKSTVEQYYSAYGLQQASDDSRDVQRLASGGQGDGDSSGSVFGGMFENMDAGNMVGMATGAAMLGMTGACLFGSLCDSDTDNDDENEDGDSAEENEPLDCKAEENFNNKECEEGLLAICMENPEATNCEKFSELYCDMSGEETGGEETGGEVVAEETEVVTDSAMVAKGEGAGSSFCAFQIEVEFCRTASNSECPSCEKLRMKTNDVCKDNPVACMVTLSPSQEAEYQSTCPSDPMFASEEYIKKNLNSEETVNTAGSSESSTSQSLSALSGDGDGNIDYSEAMNLRGGVSQTFTRIPANVDSASGQSVFAAHADEIQQRCAAGRLNNCGPSKAN